MPKLLITLCFCGLCQALQAQTDRRIFKSANGTFEFSYSAELRQCTRTRKGDGFTWTSRQGNDVCLCDPPSSATTIVCFTYPKAEFVEKPMFVAAGFYVAEMNNATSRKTCLEAD